MDREGTSLNRGLSDVSEQAMDRDRKSLNPGFSVFQPQSLDRDAGLLKWGFSDSCAPSDQTNFAGGRVRQESEITESLIQ